MRKFKLWKLEAYTWLADKLEILSSKYADKAECLFAELDPEGYATSLAEAAKAEEPKTGPGIVARNRAELVDTFNGSAGIEIGGEVRTLGYPVVIELNCGGSVTFNKATDWPFEDLYCNCPKRHCIIQFNPDLAPGEGTFD